MLIAFLQRRQAESDALSNPGIDHRVVSKRPRGSDHAITSHGTSDAYRDVELLAVALHHPLAGAPSHVRAKINQILSGGWLPPWLPTTDPITCRPLRIS